MSRARLLFWIVAAVTPLLGCAAPLQPPRSAGAVPAGPASGTHPGSSAGAAARPGAPPAAVVDSTPSREALEVLGTIPEPIPAAQRVPPPEPRALASSGGTPPQGRAEARPDSGVSPALAPADTTGSPASPSVADSTGVALEAPADTSGPEVPVPSPTLPLGQRPPPTETPPADTAASQPSPPSGVSEGSRPAPSPPAGSSPPARPAPGSPRGSAASDTCWRVQVGAPTQREKAERLREAAESQLLAPMAIEREKGLFKVRSTSCLDRLAAQRLKERAVAAGFTRAFRFAGRKP